MEELIDNGWIKWKVGWMFYCFIFKGKFKKSSIHAFESCIKHLEAKKNMSIKYD